MKSRHLTRLAVALCLGAATPAAIAQADNGAKTEKSTETTKTAVPVVKEGTLTTVIQDSLTFSTLTKALKATGLDKTLGEKGTFTIFAPTDEAFDKLPAGTLGKLLLPANKEKLRSLLLYHVVPGKVMAADLKDGKVKTMNGEKIKIDVDHKGNDIKVNDVKLFSTDVTATNGVMHSIGGVLVPKSLDGFAGLDD